MRVPSRVILLIAALSLVAATLGLIAGLNRSVTETDVINAGAALFVEETGGRALDCVGVPGEGSVWIEVRCGDRGATLIYRFDRQGNRLADRPKPST